MIKIVETPQESAEAPRSQTSLAYLRLRNDILAGRALPGDKLKINELAAQIGVSPGAIREALSRLVPDGFVVSRDQKGFVVAPLSIDDLNDLTQLRCDIEEIALRRAVERGDETWEAAVLAAAHRLRRTPRLIDSDHANPDWIARHELFHHALAAGCASPRLMALHGQLYHQSERYRNLSVHVEGDRDVDAEHQGLVDAALDRDADELVKRARAHLRRTTTLIVDASRDLPDLAAG